MMSFGVPEVGVGYQFDPRAHPQIALEFSDEEFEESDDEGSFVATGGEAPQGITSTFGGETIRILRPEGLRIIENYFETLPPDPGEVARYGFATTTVADF